MEFSQKKFLSLTPQQQHKKCTYLLKVLYGCQNPEQAQEWNTYHHLMEWMQQDGKLEADKKSISDRYHQHLRSAGLYLKEHNLLPHIKMGDKLHIKNEPLKTSIYLDNIRSAHNVGSIIRTTEAFSLGTLHFSDKTPYIDNKQVKDTAMGTQGWVECRSNMLLKDLPRPIIILETAHNAIPIHDFIFPDQFTLVVGNEEYGCSDESIQLADIALEIPLVGKKNSLNVANAFAIAAYEIRKQRTYYEQ